VFGLIAGFLAKFLIPGKAPGGIVATILLGIVGAVVGGFLGTLLGLGDLSGLATYGLGCPGRDGCVVVDGLVTEGGAKGRMPLSPRLRSGMLGRLS
jgi:uncharacterized membrane protein YeaQ/YmgE (transglycosylase-associated protein family)